VARYPRTSLLPPVLRVVGAIQFKARYAGAALGCVWSLVKPLSYFGVLSLIFAFLLRTSNQTGDSAIYVLIGILLYTFFTDNGRRRGGRRTRRRC